MTSSWTLWHMNPTYLISFLPIGSVFECGERNIYSHFLLLLWRFSPFLGQGLPSAGVSRQLSFYVIRMSAPCPGRQGNLSLSGTLPKTCPVWVAPPAAMLQPALLSSLESKLNVNSEKKLSIECSESDYWKEMCCSDLCITRVRYKRTNKRPLTTFHKPKYATDHEKWKVYFSSLQSPYILVHERLHSDHWQLKVKQNSVSGVDCYTPTSQNLLSEKQCKRLKRPYCVQL
jgi:hypothetical protein